jgi:hypothetical protein
MTNTYFCPAGISLGDEIYFTLDIDRPLRLFGCSETAGFVVSETIAASGHCHTARGVDRSFGSDYRVGLDSGARNWRRALVALARNPRPKSLSERADQASTALMPSKKPAGYRQAIFVEVLTSTIAPSL